MFQVEEKHRCQLHRKMIRLGLVLALLFPRLAEAQGKGHGVEVQPPAPKQVEARPQQFLTIPFRVTNRTGTRREFREKISLPKGWRLIAGQFPFRIDPGKTELRLVSLYVPAGTRAGRYQLAYKVEAPGKPEIQDQEKADIIVPPVIKLEVQQETFPERVIAGKTYEAVFSIISRSNVKAEITVSLKSSHKFPATAVPAKFQFAPGGTQKVRVRVQTDQGIDSIIHHRLTIKANGRSAGKTASASRSIQVKVMPRVSGKVDRFRRIPARLSLSWGYEDQKDNFQWELSGGGFLDEKRMRSIDFLFRQPLRGDEFIFGFQEEYRIDYSGPLADVHLGDRGFGFSPLTELYRYGRGIEAGLHRDAFRFNAYYMETRWEEPKETQVGTALGYRVSDAIGLGINYLKKKDTGDADLVTLEASLTPFVNAALQAEVGLGWDHTNDTDRQGHGWRVQLRGDFKERLYYFVEKLRSGSDYPGFYNDTDFLRATLSAPLAQRVRIRGSFAEDRSNLDKDPQQSSASLERRYRLGIDLDLTRATLLSFQYERDEREDLLPSPDYDNVAHAVSISINQSFSSLAIRAALRPLRIEDNLAKESEDHLTWRIDGIFSPTQHQHYSAFYSRGYEGLTADMDLEETAGFNATYELRDRFFLDLRYERKGIGEAEAETDQFLGSLKYISRWNHEFTVEARYLNFTDRETEETTSALVTYSIPFGIPVARRKDIGYVRGRVYDADDPDHPGIPDLVLYIGSVAAVTDAKGRFFFPALKVGSYYLWMEQSGLERGRIPGIQVPAPIIISAAREKKLDIPVTRAARLHVEAIIYKPAKGAAFLFSEKEEKKVVQAGGFSGLRIELTRGKETIRRTTGTQGRRTIRNLRPGSWTLRVPSQSLPRYHYVETPEQEITLNPGDEKTVKIRILPRFRRVIFLEP